MTASPWSKRDSLGPQCARRGRREIVGHTYCTGTLITGKIVKLLGGSPSYIETLQTAVGHTVGHTSYTGTLGIGMILRIVGGPPSYTGTL